MKYCREQEWMNYRTSLAVQWLRFHASNAGGMGSIPDLGIKIPHAMWPSKKKKKRNEWIMIHTSYKWFSQTYYWVEAAAAAAKLLQSCLTLCDPIDGSPAGSPVPGIFEARTLEWVAISFSNAWTWKVKVKSLSRVRLLATPWTAAHQAPPSMGFSRQEYWSGVLLPSPIEWKS